MIGDFVKRSREDVVREANKRYPRLDIRKVEGQKYYTCKRWEVYDSTGEEQYKDFDPNERMKIFFKKNNGEIDWIHRPLD